MELRSIATFKKVEMTEQLLQTLGFKPMASGIVTDGNRAFEKTVYKLGEETVTISHEKPNVVVRTRLDPVITIHGSADLVKAVQETVD